MDIKSYANQFKKLNIKDIKESYLNNNIEGLKHIARCYISHIFFNRNNDVVESYLTTKNDDKFIVNYVCVKLSSNIYENGYIVDNYDVYLNDIDMIENVVLYDDNWLVDMAKDCKASIIEEYDNINCNN